MSSNSLALPACTLILTILACGSCQHEVGETSRPDQIPLEAFFREPERGQFRLSPDGHEFAFLGDVDGRRHLLVRDISGDRTTDVTPGGMEVVRDYRWLSEDCLITLGGMVGGEDAAFHVCRSREGTSASVLLRGPVELLDPLPAVSEAVAVLIRTGEGRQRPFRMDLKNGDLMPLSAPEGEMEAWVFDHDGNLRCVLRPAGRQIELLCDGLDGRGFRTVLSVDAVRDLFLPAAFTADSRHLIAYSNLGRERVALVELDPVSGEEVRVLFEDPTYDLFGDDEADHLRFSTFRNELSYAFYTTWRRTYHFFDGHTRGIVADLEGRFPGRVVRLLSSSADESRFLVKTSADRSTGKYYLYDVDTGSSTFLDADCPWLKEEDLAPKRPFTFVARDGAIIHGYLVLPVGRATENLPLIVMPHGGPAWRNVWEMGRFREVQLLANRGYAVLQVNFRGSTGFGKTHLTQGFKQNGLRVQDDITDGVLYLVAEGLVDPDRIAIIGGSYGGYAVLAGLAFTPELYACGVDLFGVSNFFTFLSALSRFTDMSVMYERVGHPERDRVLLERTSPLFHAENIQVPVLVAQGGRDPVVDPGESDQIVEVLRGLGVPVTYVFHEDEGHGYFSQDDHWLELWATIESFLAEHLG